MRMKAFLDDPDAVSKLVATQYRVPADKLLRNSSAAEVVHTGEMSSNTGYCSRVTAHCWCSVTVSKCAGQTVIFILLA